MVLAAHITHAFDGFGNEAVVEEGDATGVSNPSNGAYFVQFPQAVYGCFVTATIGAGAQIPFTQVVAPPGSGIRASTDNFGGSVEVRIHNGSTPQDSSFHLMVVCP